MYDVIVTEVKKVSPSTEFVGLALEVPIGHFNYFSYFLNHSNHAPGVPLDWISYHHYGIPDQTKPIEQWSADMFSQLDIFLDTVKKAQQVRQQLSPQTKTTINEFGSILRKSATQPNPDPIPDIYWHMSSAVYAYGFVQFTLQGIEAVGMSQMVGFPTQYPSVSMVKWDNGGGNVRYWALKIIVEHFGLKQGARTVNLVQSVFDTKKDVFAQGFLVSELSAQLQRKVLLINKVATIQTVTLTGAKGGWIEYVDVSTGPYGQPKIDAVAADTFKIGGYAVAVLTLPPL
jgi:hypothetical protein